MLPLQQAYEVKHSILEYLKATFSFKDKAVHKAFYQFVTNPEEGIFKGPYVSLKLPFVKAKENQAIPLEIAMNFPPYDHQYKAFLRLTTQDGHQPQSTLVTTGTSSGKTECFLYPILDYCYKNIDRKGIKVIILYPMNALATDQAKRLAETIWSDKRLKGKVSAGLFIGEGKDKKKFPDTMGAGNIIENRNTILENPPDILLTNFKMLDYALLRNQFHNLWSYNLVDSSLLQFLVLDELHTYDGAQGTDVANLIRRLKLKLEVQRGQVCAVGTSATIGSGEDSVKLLTEYAERVFGETFEKDAIITENRMEVNDFFESDRELEKYIPRQIGLQESRLRENETYADYITRQKRLWQIPELTDVVLLGEELKKLQLVRDLVSITNKEIVHLEVLLNHLADINPDFRRLPEWDDRNELNPREEVINSLLALISEARIGTGKKFPFLFMQIQLWIRELSGVLREINEEPKFTWKDKVGDKYEPKALPSYYCRECGASGWLGVKDDNKNHFFSDPKQVYEYFFSNHKNIYFVNTLNHRHIDEYEPNNQINDYIHVVDLSLHENKSDQTLKITAVRKLKDTRARHVCPECNAENAIGIIGTRVATLSSITVSQILASDLDPRPEKERKILAFTNSVQDAAHQAGFVEARNYRFTFRASLQKVINQSIQTIKIDDLQKQFTDYWKVNSDSTGQNQEEAYYYRFFPADYHGKVDIDSDYRDAAKKFIPAFKSEFDCRMNWEILSEFGYNATIGRTLEKSGASAVKFDLEKLKAVFPTMKDWLEGNGLSVIQEEELLPFLNGILHRVRTRGGIDHEYLGKFRNESLQLWDLNWMRDNRHFLNKMFGTRSRFPRLLTTQPHGRGLLDSTFTNTNNWYRSYYIKSFPMASSYHALVNDFYAKLIEAFDSLGIMNRKGSGEHENFAIEPSMILVENKVSTHICNECGSKLFVAQSDDISLHSKCLDYTCPGTYSQIDQSKPNYYQLVYNRNQSPRIYATEHTGLLERRDRETKEIDFKERPRFNSLNTIVATSTLEMGIDIGTLNSAINNSIPPLTSNFLQRVGRAGRSSGSALITNFAQGKAHDLFYYEEPKDLMEGEIATPGCYLEAKDILYRHFFAYCLDCWAKADPKNNSIPGVILLLQLSNANLSAPDFFANRVVSYIKSKEHILLTAFSDFYRPDLEDSKPLDNLKAYLLEEEFYLGFRGVFAKLKEEYRHIQETIKGIDKAIKTLPNDEERRLLEAEKKALWGMKRLLDKRSLLEHLTNIGLLPNYAFPETGVTLNARVMSTKAKASENIPTDKQFEIVRSSKSALREFAPDNYFYSQGFKFAISGLNIFDWKDAGTLLVKRFCSNCDHIADKVTSTEPHCPKCGDASWASDKNQHVFVKINGVKSVNFRDKSTLDDSSDDRDSNLYRISRHLKFDTHSFQGAWGMKEIPFGIEYVKNVDIVEVNLGLSSAVNANKISINQHEDIPYHGFVTCKYCGKSTSKLNQRDYKAHYGYCKHKEREYNGKRDEVFEEVYLLREMKTEALKVLLPVQEFESESTINMFKAGLELGLKKYYKGNPQHLSIINYSEYNEKNSRFDKYLVLYDNIPGGTGYLEKLFSPAEFTTVISRAYDAIKSCRCKAKGKDGCYRCIFTYSNQYIQSELSRSKAEDLFKKIVDKSDVWETFTTGLGALTSHGQIEESELEERFIRSLRNYIEGKKDPNFKFEDFIEHGIVNYRFKISADNYSYYYVIRPQYELGPVNGVRFNTRSDFYISLSSIEKDGIAITEDSILSSVKKIAIYLDGYTYHATEENCRFFDDLKKREAIVESGEIISWTLAWSDIEKFDAREVPSDPTLKIDSMWFDTSRYKQTTEIYKKIPYWKTYRSELTECKNSFERLLWVLAHPLAENYILPRIALMLSTRQIKFGVPSADQEDIDLILNDPGKVINEGLIAKNMAKGNFYIFPELPDTIDIANIKVSIRISDLEMKSNISTSPTIRTLDKGQWEAFWQVFNLIQCNTET
jgi:DEAD/DEAH box helicase domain-containing protein